MPPAKIEAGTRWLAYCRDSGHEAQSASCDQQEKVITDLLASSKAQLVRPAYRDEARKGSSTVGRAELDKLLVDAVPGLADGICFWSSARMAREVNDAQFIRSTLRKRGYELFFISDNLPNIGEWTPLLEVVQDISNARRLKEISEEAKRGHDQALAAHLIPNGTVPVGYLRTSVAYRTDRDGKERMSGRWAKDPATAERVRLAWEMRLQGFTITAIMAKTRLFSHVSQFTRFYRNPAYMGTLRFGARTFPNFVEPYVTQAEWERVQAILDSRWKTPPRALGNEWLLRGLVRCGVCGGSMYGKICQVHRIMKKGPMVYRSEYYVCRGLANLDSTCTAKHVHARPLERAVIEAIEGAYLQPDTLASHYNEWQAAASTDPNADAELAELRATAADLTRRIDNLLDRVEGGEAVGDRLAQREKERREALARIDLLESRPRQTLLPAATALDMVGNIRIAIERGERETAQLAVAKFVLKVVATYDKPPLVTLRPPLA